MKKYIALLCFVLTGVLVLAGCSVSCANKDIENSASIEIRKYDNGELCDVYTITDKIEVNDICKTFSSLSAKKLNYHKPAVPQFSIHFLNGSGLEIQNIDFLFGNTVVTNGQIYAITDEVEIIEYINSIVSKNFQE